MAGSKVGSAWYELSANDSKLRAALTAADQKIQTTGSTAGKGFASRFGAGLSGIKQSIGGILPMVGALSAAFVATKIIGFFGDAISAASDLGETVSKVGVIFGKESLPGLEKWAEAAADALGMSKQMALDGAATFATFGKSAGLAGQDLVGFSTEMVELASDLASFHNAEPQEVILAIGAALRGEAEPMRRFGVLLDDATLRAKAFEMGIISTTKNALTPQQKVLAAHAVILDQTSDAQGDFARTSDGLANQQRILSAELENASTEIGEMLLPVMVELAHFAVDVLVPAFSTVIDGAKKLGEGIGGIVGAFQTMRSGVMAVMEVLPGEMEAPASEMKRVMVEPFEKATVEIPERMSEGVRFAAAAITAGGPVIAAEAGKVAGMLPYEIDKRDAEIRAAAYDNIVQFAAGLLDAQDKPKVAMDAMIKAQETALTRSAEITYLKGLLNSAELARGLNDRRPAVSLAAQATVTEINNRLNVLGVDGYTDGAAGGQGVASGINSKIPAVGSAAAALRGRGAQMMDMGTTPYSHGSRGASGMGSGISSQTGNVSGRAAGVRNAASAGLNMGTTPGAHGSTAGARYASGIGSQSGNAGRAGSSVAGAAKSPLQSSGDYAYGWGQRLSANYLAGLSSYYTAIRNASIRLGGAASTGLAFNSPAEAGPLSDPGVLGGWGRRLGEYFAKGMNRSAEDIRRASIALGGAAVPRIGPMPIGASGGAFGAGGNSTNLNVVININGYNQDVIALSREIATQVRLRASAI